MLRTLIFLFAGINFCSHLWAQVTDTLVISEVNLKGKIHREVLIDSAALFLPMIEERYRLLMLEGYMQASIDTSQQGHTLICSIYKGPHFKLSEITLYHDSTRSSTTVNGSFNAASVRRAAVRQITDLENNGYPFAAMRIDSVSMVSGRRNSKQAKLFATLTAGPYVVLDSLYLKSTQPLPYTYISNYLNFKSGLPYNEASISGANKRLKELAFLTIKQPAEIRFTPGKASLFVFAERKRANFFNGVAGIRPIENSTDVTLTGDVELRLLNAFNRGEEIGLTWRKLQSQTQDLEAKLMLPYVFKLPLGPDGKVKIYKRDTTFTSTELAAGINFLLSANNRLRIFAEKNRSNSLLTFITAGPLSNTNSTLYGIGGRFERLDYRWNPRKGYSINIEAATGTRRVNALSETLTESTALTRMQGSLEYYIPVFKRHCIMAGAKGAALFAPSLYDNELLRIGGLRTIRGINEESIYATAWGVLNAEYRVLLEENSAVYLFADQAWYEKKGVSGFLTDQPLNFGAGFNFQTRAGIFTFNYALGKQFDNPILVRNGKVSFGFRNLF
jgi:outer membrane translocation and assembly module TamA